MNSNNRGGPRGPTRDPMDVGLGRHTRKTTSNNPLQNLDQRTVLLLSIGLGVLVLMFVVVMMLLPSSQPAPSAQLAISYGPVKVWADGEVSRLRTVRVNIRNVTSVDAEGVQVVIALPGRQVPLSGPQRLAAGTEAEYGAQIDLLLGPKDQPQVRFGCVNCMLPQ